MSKALSIRLVCVAFLAKIFVGCHLQIRGANLAVRAMGKLCLWSGLGNQCGYNM